MMTRLTAPWLSLPGLQRLFEICEEAGATLRLVGGSVRDGLLDLPVSDIDLAIDKDPHWTMALLKKSKIKAIPTGIDHGTVTALIDKRPFQITTLRVDVKTFGRKAHVAFTEDWVQDAQRRDFTVNALYADRMGQLFDPVGGLDDLKAHCVRFIGKAELRIQEDYLRILRFFRFSARFGYEPYNAEGLEACKTFASHLPHLARERVTEEFLKILELPSPLYTLEAMNETNVLTYILHPGTWEVLKAFVLLEKGRGLIPSALLRLAAFHPVLSEVKSHLRLSRSQEATLSFLTRNHPHVTEASFKKDAYHWGKERVFDLSLLQTAKQIAKGELTLEKGVMFLQNLHDHFEDWSVPLFPLTGNDLLAQGVKKGERVGALLKAVETWWLSNDLKPDRDSCLAYLLTLL
jgi:poly(A) polymerase